MYYSNTTVSFHDHWLKSIIKMTTSSIVSDFNSSVNTLVKSIFEAFEAGELRTVSDLKLTIRQKLELLSVKVNEQISTFEQRLE